MSSWWCGACWQPYDGRGPNRLVTLQIYDTANEELVFLASGAPDGKCDNLISALKRVLNLMQRNKLGVKGLERCSKNRLREALRLFIAVDHARAFVTMGEVAQFWKVRKIVLPSLSNEIYACACVVEGEEVLTVCPEELGLQQLFVDTSRIPKEK